MNEEERTITIRVPCQVFHLDKAHFLRGSTRFFENFKGTLVEENASPFIVEKIWQALWQRTNITKSGLWKHLIANSTTSIHCLKDIRFCDRLE